jgi:phage baseplate assembly protein W
MAITRADKYTDRREKTIASDFDTMFQPHPHTGDLLRISDENAVKQSLRNLLVTSRFERPYSAVYNVGLNDLLFEPANIDTAAAIKERIQDVIRFNEPRVRVTDVKVGFDEGQNSYQATIVFNMINRTDSISLEMVLTRIR